jgi:hypothetical protein
MRWAGLPHRRDFHRRDAEAAEKMQGQIQIVFPELKEIPAALLASLRTGEVCPDREVVHIVLRA